MSDLRLVLHQFRYEQKTFRRDSAAVFFTVLLPVVFLVIFATVFGNETLESRDIKLSTYYVPGIVALQIVSATFVALAINLTTLRERGTLKRLRGTPVPAWVFVAGQIGNALVVAFLATVVLVALGRILYGVAIPGSTLPGVVVTLVLGAAAFSALGIALTAVIPTANSAPAITNALVLPLYFISGIFFPVEDAPGWLTTVASLFPVAHLAEALLTAFDPATDGLGFAPQHLGVLALWGAAGTIVAVRAFRWTARAGT